MCGYIVPTKRGPLCRMTCFEPLLVQIACAEYWHCDIPSLGISYRWKFAQLWGLKLLHQTS